MNIWIIGALALLCVSCGMYQSHFDCPPGKGIGCKPVSEVLNLIVERENESDFFVEHESCASYWKEREKHRRRPQTAPMGEKKLVLAKEHSGAAVIVEEAP